MLFHHVQDTEPAAISGGDKREVGGPRLEGMLLPMAAYRPDVAPYPLSRQALLPPGQLLPLVDHGLTPPTTTGDGACEPPAAGLGCDLACGSSTRLFAWCV